MVGSQPRSWPAREEALLRRLVGSADWLGDGEKLTRYHLSAANHLAVCGDAISQIRQAALTVFFVNGRRLSKATINESNASLYRAATVFS